MALTTLEMATKFGDFLRARLSLLDWSQEFYAKEVGVTGPFINQIVNGNRKPPLEDLELWARKLKLDDELAARFRELAFLTHAPDEIANIIQRYRMREREIHSRVAAMEAQGEKLVELALANTTLRAENATLRADLTKRIEEIHRLEKQIEAAEKRVAEARRAGYQV